MLHQRGSLKDKVLFRILKNKSPTASNICEKLNCNVKNIVFLSEDELCELWQHTKSILLEAQKLYKQTSNNEEKYAKECTVMVKLIRTITMMALETIIHRIFIPNVLLQNIMLLHSVVLPNVKHEQAKSEISHLLENWWKLDLTWKEKVITNVLKYLIPNCRSSLQHLKRFYEVRSSVVLLKCAECTKEMFKLVREETVISLEEGRMLILHLFTMGEQYILGIHNNVRVVLQNVEHNRISLYADLYVTAWLNATKKLKKFIVENCLQNIIFHCFRAHRDSAGRGQLGKNLLLFLAAMHDSKHEVARFMIHEQCKSLIWKHLKAPSSFVRCNAIEILFVTSSTYFTCTMKGKKKMQLERYYKTINDLLIDTDFEVCNVTMNGLFKMLEKYWNFIPNDTLRDWLDIFLHHTKNASNSKIRANVFIGIKNVLVKGRSHRVLEEFLPNFANSIYDEDRMVLEALIELLWHAQNQLGMPFWNIVPLSYVLDRLETTEDIFLLRQLTKLVWVRVSSSDRQHDRIKDEVVHMGMNNINAVRRFCCHSKSVISWDMSVKIIEAMLSMIKKEMKRFPLKRVLRNTRSKKLKLDNKENNYDHDCSHICNEDFNYYGHLQIYVDVTATLLIANIKNLRVEKHCGAEVNVLQTIAHELPEILKLTKGTAINESIILLCSLIPARFSLDKIEIIEILLQHLCDPNTSDDTLLTVVYVLMKWNRGETILFALTNIFSESLSVNTQYNQDNVNNLQISDINEKALELSLRILKHLLHVEHQSVLMQKYHKDILKFWGYLHQLRVFIEKKLSSECNGSNPTSEDVITKYFKVYISMIPLLHKRDVFNASEHFSDIILWVKRTLVPHISGLDLNVMKNHQTCVAIINTTLDMANSLLTEYNSTPKLCCEIVLLYCSCLSPTCGIMFINNAFRTVILLLDFGKMAYEKHEPNLLNIIIPNFICVTIVTLARYSKDILIKYANDLKILHELTQKYFSIVRSTFNDQSSYLPYITIMFNTAIGSISAEMTRIVECSRITKDKILMSKFPYLAKKILKIILNTKKYRKLSVHVLAKTITSYTRIDMLSALIVIHKIIKSNDRTVINRLKNVTLATKVHNQKQPCDTPFDRSVSRALNIVIDAILV